MENRSLIILASILLSLFFGSCSEKSSNNPVSPESEAIYNLTVTVEPAESGVVNPNSGEFENGETVEVVASPNDGWVFEGWQGDHTGSTNPATISFNTDKNITALFTEKTYPLIVNVEGEGSVQETVVAQKATDYEEDTVVELTAVPDEGWKFVGWEGDLEGSESPRSITIDQEMNVTAIFERRDYPLTLNIQGDGSVAEEVIQAKSTDYPFETKVQLTANPSEGWVFSRWEGDVTSGENSIVVEVTESKEVTAVFVRDTFKVSYTYDGKGEVTETLTSGTQAENGSYSYQSELELTAVPFEGWQFTGWNGDMSGADNPQSIMIDSDKSVTATFERRDYPLTITIDGEGTVSEKIVQAKSTDYPFETVVELTAKPATGWVFSYWQGDLTGQENPSPIEISEAKEVTAVFVRDYFTLNQSVTGEGAIMESLVSVDQAIDSSYQFGSVVELTAEASYGWEFSDWAGELAGRANPVEITVGTDNSVAAVFERKDYDLNVLVQGEGSVQEEVVQAKVTSHPYETLVQLTATPASGWLFSHWQGDLTGQENPSTIEISEAKEVTAVFVRDYFTLNQSVTGDGAITESLVSGDQATDGSYQYGSVVELTAEASYGWKFSDWAGELAGRANPVEITIGTDNSVAATIDRKEFTMSISQLGEGTITRSLVSGTETTAGYLYESKVELTAEAAPGWEFVEWTGDITSTGNPESIVVDTSKTIKTVFKEIIYTVDLTLDGQGTSNIQVFSGTEREGGYLYGTQIEIVVTPNSGWNFVYWDGDLKGRENPIITTITDSLNVIANLDESPFAGGNGSDMYPYEVSTTDQLQQLKNYTYKHFVQINDIDATETETWNGGLGFEPIGDDLLNFTGEYDGNGYTIDKLNISRQIENNVALFSITSSAVIKGVSLTNTTITGAENVGSIVALNNGQIINSSSTGEITGDINVGGLVGKNSGSIIDSYIEKTVEGKTNVGGLAGSNDGSIEGSNSKSTITGDLQTGGLVGANSGTVVESYSVGNVYGNLKTGGLIGKNTGKINYANSAGKVISYNSKTGGLIGEDVGGLIENSDSESTVSGIDFVGGLVGYATFEHRYSNSTFTNTSATGNVKGRNEVGGFAGRLTHSILSNTFAEGNVGGDTYVGGLSGNIRGSNIEDSYARGAVTAEGDNVGGLIGMAQGPAVYYGVNSKIVNSYALGDISSNGNYAGGLVGYNSGTITTSTADGAVSGFDNIGGLVGSGSGEITRSHSNGNVTGLNNIGGFVGSYNSNISYSYSTGNVIGQENKVGGFIGEQNGSEIYSSFSIGSVTGNELVGGFSGINKGGIIQDSYSQGNVIGDLKIGGLLGTNRDEGQVINSYSTGVIQGNTDVGGLIGINGAVVIGSYWDTTTSNFSTGVGTGNSDGAIGLSTTEMKSTSAIEFMSEFDWDVTWIITDSYPKLLWQLDSE